MEILHKMFMMFTKKKKKMDARDAKNLEKQLAINNSNEHVSLTMDVQAVKLAPFIRASSMY